MEEHFSHYNYQGHIAYFDYPNTQMFKKAGVTAWILANLGLMFIFRIAIFVFYIVIKLLSFTGLKRSIKPILNIFEYTVLIILFLFLLMEEFVFPILNMKQFGGSNYHFFVFNLLISIGYVVIFCLFWLYCAYRLLGSSFYFQDSKN